ncbi:MAG: flagellin [Campylobacterota bacterium]|nr:flagellin [Campylobacterota bacterium]
MDINTSYNPSIQGLVGAQSNSLERIGSALAINSASDDASGLAIADQLGLQKSSLSQSIDNMNSGIAMSNIAQSGISNQQDLLENIKTETLKAMNGTTSADGREAIANQINKYIDQYEQISDSTNYNGQTLLQTAGDTTDDLSVVGEDSIIEMSKADTKSISDQLRSFMSDFTSNPNSMSGMLDAVDNGMNQLASYASDFGSASNAFASNARNSITTEKELASAQSTIMDIDYSKEVSDFSKTNLQTQIGLIMQTQANAVQSRNINLLS